jgi:hypothetical protein
MPHQDARYPNEKMRSAMDALVARHLAPREAVRDALDRCLEAIRFFQDDVPEWARKSVDAVSAIVPEGGAEREQ